LVRFLGHLFFINSVVLSNVFFGNVPQRKRRVTLLIHRRFALRASYDMSLEGMKRFARSVLMSRSDFFVAPRDSVIAWYYEKALKLGMLEAIAQHEQGKITDAELFSFVIGPGEAARLTTQLEYCRAEGILGVCDSSQNLERFQPDGRERIPTLTTKSTLWFEGRFMIPAEKVTTLGIAGWHDLELASRTTCHPAVMAMSSNAVGHAAGNGMSVEVVLSALVWGLTCMGDKLKLGSIPRVPFWHVWDPVAEATWESNQLLPQANLDASASSGDAVCSIDDDTGTDES
jgi:hypothetical protein